MKFERAFEILIGHEGGHVWDPMDPGGETKFGLSQRAYPELNISTLTLEDARGVYLNDYWNAVRAEALPAPVRFSVFDAAVNSGNRQATLWLQRAAGVIDDGVIGPKTISAAHEKDPYELLCKFCGQRLKHFTDLKTWQRFGRGWTRRVAENLVAA